MVDLKAAVVAARDLEDLHMSLEVYRIGTHEKRATFTSGQGLASMYDLMLLEPNVSAEIIVMQKP